MCGRKQCLNHSVLRREGMRAPVFRFLPQVVGANRIYWNQRFVTIHLFTGSQEINVTMPAYQYGIG